MQNWIKIIHVAKRETRLTDEEYCALLLGAANVDSASKITTWQQYESVMCAFKKLGFKPQKKIKVEPQRERNPAWISARQEYYIRGLWQLVSRVKSEKALRAILKRITDVDNISWCARKDAQKLILALRDIAEKAGFNPDCSGTGGRRECFCR